jgi:hypothetical protein
MLQPSGQSIGEERNTRENVEVTTWKVYAVIWGHPLDITKTAHNSACFPINWSNGGPSISCHQEKKTQVTQIHQA